MNPWCGPPTPLDQGKRPGHCARLSRVHETPCEASLSAIRQQLRVSSCAPTDQPTPEPSRRRVTTTVAPALHSSHHLSGVLVNEFIANTSVAPDRPCRSPAGQIFRRPSASGNSRRRRSPRTAIWQCVGSAAGRGRYSPSTLTAGRATAECRARMERTNRRRRRPQPTRPLSAPGQHSFAAK